ncbi:MAG: Gfo/Idh/MocA family protein [Opitutaceae bacterium]
MRARQRDGMSKHPGSGTSRRAFLQHLSLGAAALASGAGLAPGLRAAENARAGRKLGVALAGLGGYSTGQLAPALRETSLCRLAGVVTGSRAKGERWAQEHGFPENCIYNYDTMTDIAENPGIDIIYIVTPPGLHAEHTIRAAGTGKHIICEKPMAVSVKECDAMIEACRAAGVKFSIGYRLHYHPIHQEVKRLATGADYGPFESMNGAFGFRTGRKSWRLTQKLGGGGPLMDVGIYVIQSACMAAGTTPVAATARELPKTRPEFFDEVEETLVFDLEFPGGVHCEGRTSYNESYNRFRAESSEGWIEIEPAFSYGGLRARTSRGPLPASSINQQAAQMDAFAQVILDDGESIVPGEMGRRDMQIITAIYESARHDGRRMEIGSGESKV